MFNVKLEEKSLKVSFKTLPIKIQRSKTRQPPTLPPPPPSPPFAHRTVNHSYKAPYASETYGILVNTEHISHHLYV